MPEQTAILTRLLEIQEQQKNLEGEAKALWAAFYEIADAKAGEEQPYRYLDEEKGYVLARIVAQVDRIDAKKLEKLLNHEQWLAITLPQRVLDETLLDAEIKRDHIKADEIEPAVERKTQLRKFGPRKATKEELEEIAKQDRLQAR